MIALEYMRSREKTLETDPSKMLPTLLGPLGVDQVTHAICSRFGYSHQVVWMAETLAARSEDWCASTEYTTSDGPSLIKSRMCVITEDTSFLLWWLGLEVKS